MLIVYFKSIWSYIGPIVFTAGFLNGLRSAIAWLWVRVFKERITATFFIAYSQTGIPGDVLNKCIFLNVTNGSKKPVQVNRFLFEDYLWYRIVGRKFIKMVVGKPIMTVPAGGGMQMNFSYLPANPIWPTKRYFGLQLSDGRSIWITRQKWNRALKEYRADFPNWKEHTLNFKPLRLNTYGAFDYSQLDQGRSNDIE